MLLITGQQLSFGMLQVLRTCLRGRGIPQVGGVTRLSM